MSAKKSPAGALVIPAEAWSVLIDCPTPVNARKAVQFAVAAELERMAHEIDNAPYPYEELLHRAAELRGAAGSREGVAG